MTNDFCSILKRAQSGEHNAIEQLLEIYNPLINHHSLINGVIDEDLRQFLILRFLIAVKTFKIR